MGIDINLADETSYTTQYQEALLKYVENEYGAEHQHVPVNNSKPYRATISSPVHRHQGPINHALIHMNCPAMMRNTQRLTMWLRRHLDKEIAQRAYCPRPGSIRIRCMNH